MFEVLGLVIGLIAILIARSAHMKIASLSQRLAALEGEQTPIAQPRDAAPGAMAPAPAAEMAAAPLVPEPAEPPAAPPPAMADTAASEEAAKADEAKTPPKPSFEERIGTRWVVWLGGLTLALGGLFLVRYSIEQGLIGPAARITLGALFALALLAAGEWTRRRQATADLAAHRLANIPAILTAAGTAVAYGTIFAAYALYDFLVPATAFILMGLVALATLAAALLHGPALAAIGTLAGFVTPVLVSSEQPDFWALYIYLAVVGAAALALARARMWRWLVLTAIGLGFIWMLVDLDVEAYLAPHAFHALAGFALSAVLVVSGFLFGPAKQAGRIDTISVLALGAWLIAAMLLVLAQREATGAMIVFAVLVGASLVIAWRSEAASAIVPIAAGAIALVFLDWTLTADLVEQIVPGGAMPGLAPEPYDAAIQLHLILGLAFALAFFAGSLAIQGRFDNAAIGVLWTSAGIALPLVILIALYLRIAHFDQSIPFALIALIVSAANALAAEWTLKRPARPGLPTAIALYATGALAALALALTFALEKGWLTVALALIAPAASWVSLRRPVPMLRWLAAIMAMIVTARLLWEPRIAGDEVGAMPIFNWLLYGYGVPALSFIGAGIMLRRRGDDGAVRIVDSAAILFTALLVALQIRHFIYFGDIYRNDAHLAEIGTQVIAALAMAIGLERIFSRTASPVHGIAAIILAGLAGLGALFGLLIVVNPLWRNIAIEGALINLLLLAYALPALLAAFLSYIVRERRPAFYANIIGGFALVLALAYVSLMVRRFYHGPLLALGPVGVAEQYSYSLAWLAFGVVLLGFGLIRRSQPARIASAAVIALTILKAFLIDMGDLTGIYRALSFIGLGLVLVVIGYLYQRILFRPKSAGP